jgi:cytochrome c-type biogenesis protein CcmH
MGNVDWKYIQRRWLVRGGGILVGLVVSLVAVFGITQAQETLPTPSVAGGVTADEVNKVARELWCPLCSGVRLDSCELKACDQMKEVIAIKLSEGEDTASIKNYFVEQYGPQVLGAPPLEGFNWLAWILPFVVLIGGGVFLWMRAQHMIRPATAASEIRSRSAVEQSEYDRKLEEELKRYG